MGFEISKAWKTLVIMPKWEYMQLKKCEHHAHKYHDLYYFTLGYCQRLPKDPTDSIKPEYDDYQGYFACRNYFSPDHWRLNLHSDSFICEVQNAGFQTGSKYNTDILVHACCVSNSLINQTSVVHHKAPQGLWRQATIFLILSFLDSAKPICS